MFQENKSVLPVGTSRGYALKQKYLLVTKIFSDAIQHNSPCRNNKLVFQTQADSLTYKKKQ